jgi:hypothetical protein
MLAAVLAFPASAAAPQEKDLQALRGRIEALSRALE